MKKLIIYICTCLILICCDSTAPQLEKTEYHIGELGPGNGIVFYDDTIGYDFNNDGLIDESEKNRLTEYRFLEIAPANWKGTDLEPQAAWGVRSVDVPGLTNYSGHSRYADFGSGAEFSELLLEYNRQAGLVDTAVQMCQDYRGGNKADWFLPSFGELLLYRERMNGFVSDVYWTSTEGNDLYSWQLFKHGGTYYDEKHTEAAVRPIRMF